MLLYYDNGLYNKMINEYGSATSEYQLPRRISRQQHWNLPRLLLKEMIQRQHPVSQFLLIQRVMPSIFCPV
jgi:hypothetical protein